MFYRIGCNFLCRNFPSVNRTDERERTTGGVYLLRLTISHIKQLDKVSERSVKLLSEEMNREIDILEKENIISRCVLTGYIVAVVI